MIQGVLCRVQLYFPDWAIIWVMFEYTIYDNIYIPKPAIYSSELLNFLFGITFDELDSDITASFMITIC